MSKLDAIRQRVQAATEGPWEEMGDEDYLDGIRLPSIRGAQDWSIGYAEGPDAAFIAHARTDVPLLLAVVDASDIHPDRVGYVDYTYNGSPRRGIVITQEDWDALRAALAPLLEPEPEQP